MLCTMLIFFIMICKPDHKRDAVNDGPSEESKRRSVELREVSAPVLVK